jgi:hypothetical protein
MTGTRFAILLMVSVSVAGCGSAARSMLERNDNNVQVSANPDLAMPPDLRLPPPGSGPPPAQPQPSYNTAYDSNAIYDGGTPTAPAANKTQFGDDVYAKAGISIYKPDGTRKTDPELREELRKYYVAKKRQKNSNYGTVFNIGNIFKDE